MYFYQQHDLNGESWRLNKCSTSKTNLTFYIQFIFQRYVHCELDGTLTKGLLTNLYLACVKQCATEEDKIAHLKWDIKPTLFIWNFDIWKESASFGQFSSQYKIGILQIALKRHNTFGTDRIENLFICQYFAHAQQTVCWAHELLLHDHLNRAVEHVGRCSRKIRSIAYDRCNRIEDTSLDRCWPAWFIPVWFVAGLDFGFGAVVWKPNL